MNFFPDIAQKQLRSLKTQLLVRRPLKIKKKNILKLRVESWEYKLRVRYFPLQYNKNTKDLRFQTNLLLEFSMHSEPSPQHQMSGNLPPRNREESREKYHEVVLENPGDLTMYTVLGRRCRH